MGWDQATPQEEHRGTRAKPKLDRLPPHSIESEQGVLGCILLSPKSCLSEAVSVLAGPIVFYDLRHQTLFEAMIELSKTIPNFDLITLPQYLKQRNLLEGVGGLAYLSALPDCVPSSANLSYYAGIVQEKYLLRYAVQVCTEIVGKIFNGKEDVDETMDAVEAELLAISRLRTSRIERSMKVLIDLNIQTIEATIAEPKKVGGIPTGFVDVDKITHGMAGGDVWVIGGRPGQGKSSMLMNIADHVAVELKIPVGIFSLEMRDEKLTMRMLCSRARVSARDVQDGFLVERDFPKLTGAAGKLASAPIKIACGRITDMQLRSKARVLYEQEGCRLFGLDYFQLLRGHKNRYESRRVELDELSGNVKDIAMELNVPFIVLAQLSREVEKQDRRPRASDLRETGAIEQDADLVGLLYRKKDEDEDEGPDPSVVPMCLDIVKQRDGPEGVVDLVFLKRFTRFESAAKLDQDDMDFTPKVPTPTAGQ